MGSVFIGFSSHGWHFLVCLIIFEWLPGIAIFTLLDAGYVYIPRNILKLSIWMQLSYLETDSYR